MAISYLLLQETGLFDFAQAEEIVERFFSAAEPDGPASLVETAKEHVYLTAAEASLLAVVSTPQRWRFPRPAPWQVREFAANLAIAKGQCTFTMPEHVLRSDAQMRLWDLVLFAGDMAKIAANFGESPSELPDMQTVVERIEAQHRRVGGSAYSFALAESGIFRLQGAVWLVRLGVARRRTEMIRDDLLRYLSVIGWGDSSLL